MKYIGAEAREPVASLPANDTAVSLEVVQEEVAGPEFVAVAALRPAKQSSPTRPRPFCRPFDQTPRPAARQPAQQRQLRPEARRLPARQAERLALALSPSPRLAGLEELGLERRLQVTRPQEPRRPAAPKV